MIEWRKKWASNWDKIKYCSHACRRRRTLKKVEFDLEGAILDLLAQRKVGATICPSEAAKVVGGHEWQPLMEQAREAARRLVAQRKIDICQKGRVVNGSTAKGPIRLRLRQAQ